MATLNQSFINFILGMEGGYANHPADKGGETYKGVIWTTFQSLAKSVLGIEPTKANFLSLTNAQTGKIVGYFWNSCHANFISSQSIAEYIVDWYWGSGKYAVMRIQKVLNNSFAKKLIVDGLSGPATISAINSVPAKALLEALFAEREQHYRDIVKADPSQSVFLNGWIRRATELFEKKKLQLLPAELVS